MVNPATGAPFAQCPHASKEDVDAAVVAAATALPSWSVTPVSKRCDALLAAAAVIEEKKKEIAALLTKEQGKPLEMAKGEMEMAIGRLKSVAADIVDPKGTIRNGVSCLSHSFALSVVVGGGWVVVVRRCGVRGAL